MTGLSEEIARGAVELRRLIDAYPKWKDRYVIRWLVVKFLATNNEGKISEVDLRNSLKLVEE